MKPVVGKFYWVCLLEKGKQTSWRPAMCMSEVADLKCSYFSVAGSAGVKLHSRNLSLVASEIELGEEIAIPEQYNDGRQPVRKRDKPNET